MADEKAIIEELAKQFPAAAESARVQRERRVMVETSYDGFAALFKYAVRNMHFSHLGMITGLDQGDKLGVIYHLIRGGGFVLSIKTTVPKHDPKIETVTGMFPGAVLYEKELVDLLGFKIDGMPKIGGRYPLRDDWPEGQHPLRKDWIPEGLPKYGKGVEGGD